MDLYDIAVARKLSSGGGGGGSSDIATTLQSVQGGSVTSTDENGNIFWFEQSYEENTDAYVDALTLTVDGESYTFTNALVGSFSHQYANYYVYCVGGMYVGEDYVYGGAFGLYPIPETSVAVEWSASNIYTASAETKTLFPDKFAND